MTPFSVVCCALKTSSQYIKYRLQTIKNIVNLFFQFKVSGQSHKHIKYLLKVLSSSDGVEECEVCLSGWAISVVIKLKLFNPSLSVSPRYIIFLSKCDRFNSSYCLFLRLIFSRRWIWLEIWGSIVRYRTNLWQWGKLYRKCALYCISVWVHY